MQRIELTLSAQAYMGRALGRDDEGRVIFVPFGMQDERVLIEVVEPHKRWALGRIVEILEPSPLRIQPRCRHFGDCGGCDYQHIPYETQTNIKADVLRAQLERLGRFEAPPLQPTVASPSPWHTRNHMQFHLDPTGRLGFMAAGSDRVVAIQECHLPQPDLNQLWPQIEVEPVPGLERLGLRSNSAGEQMIVFHGQGAPQFDFSTNLAACVVWISESECSVMAGDDHFWMELLDRPLRVSAGSFFQVHTQLAQALVQRALEALQLEPGQVVYDLYAGVGLFSLFMAEQGAHVIAVEQSPWAVFDFEHNLYPYEQVALYASRVEDALASIEPNPQAVLVDPPRAGLGPEVIEALLQRAPARLVYVSCDPSTLARDGQRLRQGGYTLQYVIPFDLFPQTYHIESLSLWTRAPTA